MGKKTLTNAHCLLELIEKAHVTNLKRFSGLQECQALARGFDWTQDAETLPSALLNTFGTCAKSNVTLPNVRRCASCV